MTLAVKGLMMMMMITPLGATRIATGFVRQLTIRGVASVIVITTVCAIITTRNTDRVFRVIAMITHCNKNRKVVIVLRKARFCQK